jgi:hypothetical protein
LGSQITTTIAIIQAGSVVTARRLLQAFLQVPALDDMLVQANNLEENTMKKVVRFLVVSMALLAFASATVAMAATEFYVIKDVQGKVSILDKKPADEKSIVKGPFATKADAEKAVKEASAAKPSIPPLG